MLSEHSIAKISLAASAIGIVLLFVFAESFEAGAVKIVDIDQSMLGRLVQANALVKSSYCKQQTCFMQLYDGTGEIKAVLFNPSEEQRKTIAKGMFATFEGKVQLYKNELELVVEMVEEWS